MPKRKRHQTRKRESARDLAIANLGLSYVTEARLDTAEMRHIKKVLDAADGNISLAASLLGLPRRTLQRKLKRAKALSRRKPVRRRKHGSRRR